MTYEHEIVRIQVFQILPAMFYNFMPIQYTSSYCKFFLVSVYKFFLFLAYRNITDFCIFPFNPLTLLNQLISFSSFTFRFVGIFYVGSYIICDKDSFSSSFFTSGWFFFPSMLQWLESLVKC